MKYSKFQLREIEIIKREYKDILGDDIKLLDEEDGLEKLSKICMSKLKKIDV
ncbi:MAG TPA: hypothetical protein PLE45_04240 [Spirochaetota bacterium]|nr:hypothetical protein [Spirochaetota bacterium]HPP05234.1 hypothetical protein [Spirochaetota bacterium]